MSLARICVCNEFVGLICFELLFFAFDEFLFHHFDVRTCHKTYFPHINYYFCDMERKVGRMSQNQSTECVLSWTNQFETKTNKTTQNSEHAYEIHIATYTPDIQNQIIHSSNTVWIRDSISNNWCMHKPIRMNYNWNGVKQYGEKKTKAINLTSDKNKIPIRHLWHKNPAQQKYGENVKSRKRYRISDSMFYLCASTLYI